MDDRYARQMLLALVIAIAAMATILAVVYMKFPDNAFVIIPCVVVVAVIGFFVQKKDRAEGLETYYRTVQEIGTPVTYSGSQAAFERNGTRFDVDFPQGKHSNYFKVNFHLPNIRQKFSVQNKSLATVHHNDCYWIEQTNSPLPPEFLLQSRNPDYLLELLKIPIIRDEILSYDASMWSRIAFSFEDGNFEFIWTPPMSEHSTGFDRACRTAVTFHGELQKFSAKYLKPE